MATALSSVAAPRRSPRPSAAPTPETDARKLLSDALAEYRRTHGHQSARIVLHKTSQFSAQEVSGFQGAADERDIDRAAAVDPAPRRAASVPHQAALAVAGY